MTSSWPSALTSPAREALPLARLAGWAVIGLDLSLRVGRADRNRPPRGPGSTTGATSKAIRRTPSLQSGALWLCQEVRRLEEAPLGISVLSRAAGLAVQQPRRRGSAGRPAPLQTPSSVPYIIGKRGAHCFLDFSWFLRSGQAADFLRPTATGRRAAEAGLGGVAATRVGRPEAYDRYRVYR